MPRRHDSGRHATGVLSDQAALARGGTRQGAARWRARFLVGLIVPLRSGAADGSCSALDDMMARLNPGFWAPSFVFRSLKVRPGAIHPPNITRHTRDVELTGACDPSLFRADSFEWRRPTSDGGDWIASTSAKPMQINVDGIPCPLTGIAVTTLGWPSLRLQFEECPRKTAVEVALKNGTEDGVKIVHWMCKVAVDSRLCEEATQKLTITDPSTEWPTQLFLDLGQLAVAASQGATRMQVYENCFENLDWFVINTPLGVDPAEWEMLLALRSVLAPSLQSTVRLNANVVVETVCMPDCLGRMAEKCLAKPVTVLDEVQVLPVAKEEEDDGSFEFFVERSSNAEVAPWLAGVLACFFLVGSVVACCAMSCAPAPPKVPERRIKKVAVVYHDIPEVAQTFFSH